MPRLLLKRPIDWQSSYVFGESNIMQSMENNDFSQRQFHLRVQYGAQQL